MNGPTPEEPCGIASLLPSFSMSCRGRAEAFARRLQSRLRTLGTQSADESTNEEDPINQASDRTWISTSLDAAEITSIQPSLRQISNEADSFFDFDCEPESPGSPADECEYSRLIETASTTTPNEFASESGYICSSPLSVENETHDNSHSSSDGPYFDPETSETDQRSLPTDYFDCDESKIDDTPNTTNILNGHCNQNPIDILNDSSESLSESLPPSQESSSTNNTTAATPSSLNFTEVSSSSDSTLQDIILNELQSQCDESVPLSHHSNRQQKNGENYENNKETPLEKLKSECPCSLVNGIESILNINDTATLLICTPEIVKISPEKETPTVSKKSECDESSSVNGKKHFSSGDTDDDDDYRPQRIQRSSSLKTGKTPPGTPGRKKIVRFADVLGLDLADVKTFLDEVPTIPKSAYEDLEVAESEQPIQLGPRVEKLLMPLFQQPGGIPNFLDVVREKQVSLENAVVSDAINLTISGCVRVRNLDFHKSVHIRYTLDNWKSIADLQANYIQNSCDGFSDKFSFVIFGNSLTVGQRLEFAVRFHCKGQQYWDNNYGANYCFQCLPSSNNIARPVAALTSSPPHMHSTNTNAAMMNSTDAWCSSFY